MSVTCAVTTSPVHHLAAGDDNVQRGERAPDHLGQHWREDEMILAADEHDLDLGRKFALQVLRERTRRRTRRR
jgi:hypothetical protein